MTKENISQALEAAKKNPIQPKSPEEFNSFLGMQLANVQNYSFSVISDYMGQHALQDYETKSMQYRSHGCLRAGYDNRLYQRISELIEDSDLAQRSIAFLVATFYTELGFKKEGQDLSKKDEDGNYGETHRNLIKLLEKKGIDENFKTDFGNDVFGMGCSSIQISYNTESSNQKPIRARITKSRKVRLTKPAMINDGSEFPQEVLVSSNNWKSTRKGLLKYPIIGSTKDGFGHLWYAIDKDGNLSFSPASYVKNKAAISKADQPVLPYVGVTDFNDAKNEGGKAGFTGYYLAIIPNIILEYLWLPYWYSSASLNTIWSHTQMAAIKAGYMKRSLFKAYFIILSRGKLADEAKEEKVKAIERAMIENESGSEKAGGQIIMWSHDNGESKPYIQIVEIPQITNHQFLSYLDKGYDQRGAFAFGIDPELLNLDVKNAGFSNKAATLLFKFLVMMGDVGFKGRQPYLSFVKFMLSQMGEEVDEVYFTEPDVLTFLKEQVAKEKKANSQQITDKVTEGLSAQVTAQMQDATMNLTMQIQELVEQAVQTAKAK